MKRIIYADNAATTRLSQRAFDVMTSYMLDDFANSSQPYSLARNAKLHLKIARQTIAECIGASPDEIFFTSGGTESDNWVIKSSLFSRRNIITAPIEHHAILNSCDVVKQLGIEVSYLSVDKSGMVNLDSLNQLINENSLVSVMLANNEIGTVQPILQLADITHSKGALFHTDAVQAVGHIPINVKQLGVDLLSASAHKFNGPKGIGFLYIRKGININPLINGGMQENGMRAGTENIASIIGMAEALKENVETIDHAGDHLRNLENKLIGGIFECGIDFIRNGIYQLPGNVSLSFKGQPGEGILHRLDLKGIMVSTGSACDSKNTQISHVLKAINLDENYAKGTIRISLGKDNTEEDISDMIAAIKSIFDIKAPGR